MAQAVSPQHGCSTLPCPCHALTWCQLTDYRHKHVLTAHTVLESCLHCCGTCKARFSPSQLSDYASSGSTLHSFMWIYKPRMLHSTSAYYNHESTGAEATHELADSWLPPCYACSRSAVCALQERRILWCRKAKDPAKVQMKDPVELILVLRSFLSHLPPAFALARAATARPRPPTPIGVLLVCGGNEGNRQMQKA